MAEPIEVTVLRAWDGMVVTAWWDPVLEGETKIRYLNIRRFKSAEHSSQVEATFRLTSKEADKLIELIQSRGNA